MLLNNFRSKTRLRLGAATVALSLLGWLSPSFAQVGSTVDLVLTGSGTETSTGLVQDVLTMSNNGPGSATATSVSTTLPAGVTFVSGTACNGSGPSVAGIGTVVSCNPTLGAALAPGGKVNMNFNVQVPASQLTLSLLFTARSAETDSNIFNNSTTIKTQNTSLIDISLTGSGTETTAGLATDNITISNAGPAGATGVKVTTALPSGVSFVAASSSSGCTASGQAVTCTAANLAAKANESVTIAAQDSSANSSLSLTFIPKYDQVDDNTANDDVTITTQRTASSDLALTGSGTESSTGLVTDTLTLTNNGPDGATSAVVTTTLPSGVSFNAASSSSICTASGQSVTCSVGSLAASASTTVKVAAQAPATQLSLALTFSGSAAQTDTNPSNNSVTVTTQNTALVDLSLTGSGTETTGGLVTDTLTLKDAGPSAATGAAVTTTLPSGVSFVAASSSTGCTASGQVVTCSVGNLAVNSPVSMTVAAQTTDAAASLSLTYTAQAVQTDDNSSNNSVTITTSGAQSDLVLSGIGGETLTGLATDNLTVANDGPGANTSVVITGTLPTGASFVSGSSSSICAASGQTVTCTVGNLADNASASVKVVVQAAASQSSLSVPFSVSGTLTDPNTSNNSVTVTTSTTYLSYQYDGNGFISKRTSTGGSSAYLLYSKSGQLIGEYDSSGTAKRENIYMGHALVAYSNAGKTTDGSCTPAGSTTPTYTVTDPLDSAIAGSDACGGMMWTQPYYPYGKRQAYPALGQNDQWFAGKYSDDLTQLVDMGARQYSPSFGRFMSMDPAGVSPANFHSFNRYEYANNNPYRYVDPDGANPLNPLDWIAFGKDVGALLIDEGIYGAARLAGNEDVANMAVESMVEDRFDAAASTAGLEDPIPGGGQAIKAAHVAEEAEEVAQAAHVAEEAGSRVGALPKPPRGPGSVPKADRDPKRFYTPEERAAKRAEQGNKCANGCGKDIDASNSAGHHKKRHADGGPTDSDNHAEVCVDCHDDLHSGGNP